MSALGHDQFAVIGHDRGARVAYRIALDHPHKITRLAVLNIIPTIEQFERMSGGPSLGYWPSYLLAQPAPLPERLLSADPAESWIMRLTPGHLIRQQSPLSIGPHTSTR